MVHIQTYSDLFIRIVQYFGKCQHVTQPTFEHSSEVLYMRVSAL